VVEEAVEAAKAEVLEETAEVAEGVAMGAKGADVVAMGAKGADVAAMGAGAKRESFAKSTRNPGTAPKTRSCCYSDYSVSEAHWA